MRNLAHLTFHYTFLYGKIWFSGFLDSVITIILNGYRDTIIIHINQALCCERFKRAFFYIILVIFTG
jgi:hypothetical protein